MYLKLSRMKRRLVNLWRYVADAVRWRGCAVGARYFRYDILTGYVRGDVWVSCGVRPGKSLCVRGRTRRGTLGGGGGFRGRLTGWGREALARTPLVDGTVGGGAGSGKARAVFRSPPPDAGAGRTVFHACWSPAGACSRVRVDTPAAAGRSGWRRSAGDVWAVPSCGYDVRATRAGARSAGRQHEVGEESKTAVEVGILVLAENYDSHSRSSHGESGGEAREGERVR